MPELGAAAFLGEGDLNHFFHFPGTGVSSNVFASTGAEETPKGEKKTSRRTKEGVFFFFFFFSKGFVINRKGCEAEIAESIPCREKGQSVSQCYQPAANQLISN